MRLLILLAMTIITFFPGVTNALDYKLYGDINVTAFQRMFTRFEHDSIGEDTATFKAIWGPDSIGTLSSQDWIPTGLFGFQIQTDQFLGCIEFGVGANVRDSKLSGSSTTRVLYNKYGSFFKVNKWFAQWLMNDILTLTMGQDFTPTNFLNNNKVISSEIGYGNYGVFYTGPRPMFQLGLSLADNLLEAKLAAIKVDTINIPVQNQDGGDVTNEIMAPKVEGSLQLNLDNEDQQFGLRTKIAGGFQSYETFKEPQDQHIDSVAKEDWTLGIKSYVLAGDVGLRVWRFTFTISAFMGQNLAPYGIVAGEPGAWWHENEFLYMKMYHPIHGIDTLKDTASAKGYGHTLYNSTQQEISFVLGFKLNEYLYFEGGYQDINGEHELEDQILSAISKKTQGINSKWDDSYNFGWYIQAMATIYENLNITVELGENKFGKYKGMGKYGYGALRFGLKF